MIKQICILTKSYKNGGYCVAGIDMQSREWVRLVSSEDPHEDEIKKSQMFLDDRPIDCFDVVEFDFLKHIPSACQTENWLINQQVKPKYIKSLKIEDLLDIIKIDRDENFILNKSYLLNANEVLHTTRSLFVYHVKNLRVDAASYEYFGEIRFKYKCVFEYGENVYSNISLTDPVYRDPSKNEEILQDALIVASLPCIPYDNDFYKFVAKIIPIDKRTAFYLESPKWKTKLEIKQEGFFYTVLDNDALILNKYFGYKLIDADRPKTGFPIKSADKVIKKIKALQIDYEILNKYGKVKESESFPQNHYEIIDPREIDTNSKAKKESGKTRFERFAEVLQGLSQGYNSFTGEMLNNFDEELKISCQEMLDYFENKIQRRQKILEEHSNLGKRWTSEEDELLEEEFKEGLSITEIAQIHARLAGGIRARLRRKGLLE